MRRLSSVFFVCCCSMLVCYSTLSQTAFVVQTLNQQWQNTGFSVTSGDKLVIVGKGVWQRGGGNTQPDEWQGPDGPGWGGAPSDHLCPGASDYGLVGKIGPSGSCFGVGSYYEANVSTSGTLYLAVNDWVAGGYGDNYGYLVAFIMRNPQGTVDVPPGGNSLPKAVSLKQNYPNPFNPGTSFEYSLEHRSIVKIELFNDLGQLVATLVDGMQEPGTHTVSWDGRATSGEPAPSGVYFYRLETDGGLQTKKMILLK